MAKTKARLHLGLAKRQLERVQTASWDPQDPEGAVTWAFYAYENALVAAAEAFGVTWQKTHPSKVEAASRLHKRGILSADVGPMIEKLNELRKDVQYGEPGPELAEVDLQDLETELEAFIDEVGSLIDQNG